MIPINNLYTSLEPNENREIFTTLFQNNSLKIESIRSWLKTPGELYNQEEDEWVLLLVGDAKIALKDTEANLQAGDYFFIPRHTPHRVLSTSKDALWLGVFSS